jgi:heterodisulfide reductase subunit B
MTTQRTYGYYPGCSLHATAREYADSVEAVFGALGVALEEIDDWNCCGASAAHSTDHDLGLALPARNLKLAQEQGLEDVVMPCAGCYNRHAAAEHALRTDPEERAKIENVVDFAWEGRVRARALLDVLINDVGLRAIRARVKTPLREVRAAAYYGCLLVRPPELAFEDVEYPRAMGDILSALGADVRPYAYATECCGGGLSLTAPDAASRMVGRLVDRARETGAEAMAVSCPLCQVNLEMRQPDDPAGKMPVLYITELMGLAFGLERAKDWWKKHLIGPGEIVSV